MSMFTALRKDLYDEISAITFDNIRYGYGFTEEQIKICAEKVIEARAQTIQVVYEDDEV